MDRTRGMRWVIVCLALLASATALASEPVDHATSDWNDGAIAWMEFAPGMSEIQSAGKPGILIFFTKWCPHCKNYSWVFHDPEIVELAKHFVMIRVDRDAEETLNERYGSNGAYVPRTLFLQKNGRVDWTVRGSNEGYPYFLDEHDPAELRALMRQVLQ